MYTIGFTAADGKAGNVWGRSTMDLPKPSADSLEDLCLKTGKPFLFIDFKSLPQDHWLRGELVSRPLGYGEMIAIWPNQMDAMCYIKTMFPSTRENALPEYARIRADQPRLTAGSAACGAPIVRTQALRRFAVAAWWCATGRNQTPSHSAIASTCRAVCIAFSRQAAAVPTRRQWFAVRASCALNLLTSGHVRDCTVLMPNMRRKAPLDQPRCAAIECCHHLLIDALADADRTSDRSASVSCKVLNLIKRRVRAKSHRGYRHDHNLIGHRSPEVISASARGSLGAVDASRSFKGLNRLPISGMRRFALACRGSMG